MLKPGGTAPSSKLAEKLPPRATPAKVRRQLAVRITNRVEAKVIFIECLLLWLTHVPNVIRLSLNWPLRPRIVNSILAAHRAPVQRGGSRRGIRCGDVPGAGPSGFDLGVKLWLIVLRLLLVDRDSCRAQGTSPERRKSSRESLR